MYDQVLLSMIYISRLIVIKPKMQKEPERWYIFVWDSDWSSKVHMSVCSNPIKDMVWKKNDVFGFFLVMILFMNLRVGWKVHKFYRNL